MTSRHAQVGQQWKLCDATIYTIVGFDDVGACLSDGSKWHGLKQNDPVPDWWKSADQDHLLSEWLAQQSDSRIAHNQQVQRLQEHNTELVLRNRNITAALDTAAGRVAELEALLKLAAMAALRQPPAPPIQLGDIWQGRLTGTRFVCTGVNTEKARWRRIGVGGHIEIWHTFAQTLSECQLVARGGEAVAS